VAGGGELRAQLEMVVDLAVDGDQAPRLVAHRLRGARVEVDDRQPPVAERERAVDREALAVRAAVRERRGQRADGLEVGRAGSVEPELAGEAAHVRAGSLQARSRRTARRATA
jgi:hypothetical protein